MKKLAILLAFFGLTALTSCEMEKYPADKQVMDTALETLADLEKFEAGVYSTFRAAYNVKEFGENYGALHRWEYGIDDYDIYDIWVYAYYAIANANFVISNKDEITYDKENPEEVAIFNTILGEMYFVRAMSHFLILDKFAGAYNAAKADEAYSGIPIISAFNPTEVPSRATMNTLQSSLTWRLLRICWQVLKVRQIQTTSLLMQFLLLWLVYIFRRRIIQMLTTTLRILSMMVHIL